jgi:hypothetical protein
VSTTFIKIAHYLFVKYDIEEKIMVDQTAANTLAKYLNAQIVGDTSVPTGALPTKVSAASVNFKDAAGNFLSKDMRVKIRVPSEYSSSYYTSGSKSELSNLEGIIFPYTPQITYEHRADYASSNPMHSNYGINFYQRSSITPISISGKFTVQNERDAAVYLATVHMLRALTKMKSGGSLSSVADADSGSPPPVCRLDAYGTFMLDNVPVAISSFRIELPESVDYFTVGTGTVVRYEKTSVPTISTIAVTCLPMYSRAEMQDFTVSGWLTDLNIKKAGYL